MAQKPAVLYRLADRHTVLVAGDGLAPSSPEDLADLALEDLLQVEVSSASRFSQSIEEAPASVTVLGEDELRERGYGTLAEALVTAPGVYSSNDQSYTYLGVRGFNRPGDYGTRILLLTDGARRNDPLFDQALLGNEAPIEIDWVKRLEFVPGPASAIYGSNALFGTANAVMLSGGDINGARVSVDAGSEQAVASAWSPATGLRATGTGFLVRVVQVERRQLLLPRI